MKIRTGFVSNSSSSSYVLIMTKADHDKVLEKLHPLARNLADQLSENHVLAEMPIVVTQWMDGNLSSFEYISCDPELVKDCPEEIGDCWEEFTTAAKASGGIMSTVDC